MNRVLVDTNVVSFLFKDDTRAKMYQPHIADKEAVISFMTLAELQLWALIRRWGESRRKQLAEHIRRFAIHPYDPALCIVWARITYSARKKGRPMEPGDAWIAATAVHHGLPLVTHNTRDFRGVEELEIITEADR